MASRQPPLESLTIYDYSDREFLLVVVDCYDADGWAESSVVQRRMNLAYRRTASSRLSWLARFGAVEREYERDEHGALRLGRTGKPRPTQRWRLTEVGETLALGKLKRQQELAMAMAEDGHLLLLTRMVAERARRSNDDTSVKLAQREWRHQWGRSPGRT